MATIAYPKVWNAGDVLTAVDLDAQFNAVPNITNILTTQLAVGAAINAIVSAPLATSASIANGTEGTICTLPSLTTRGGRVVLLPFAIVAIQAVTVSASTVSFRVKRGPPGGPYVLVTNGQMDVSVASTAGITTMPVPVPPFTETPAAGSYGYILTVVSPNASVTISTPATNLGQVFALELA